MTVADLIESHPEKHAATINALWKEKKALTVTDQSSRERLWQINKEIDGHERKCSIRLRLRKKYLTRKMLSAPREHHARQIDYQPDLLHWKPLFIPTSKQMPQAVN